jgi:hypothetical protein
MAKKAAKNLVSLDFDAAVEADSKLMKHVDDYPAFVGWAFAWLNRVLEAAGKEPLDEAALKHPGEYFDEVVSWVKASKPTSVKAQFVKSAVLMALDYIHKFIHPEHVEA